MAIKIGINGLGRIGRCVARAIIEEGYDDIQLVAANGSAKKRRPCAFAAIRFRPWPFPKPHHV